MKKILVLIFASLMLLTMLTACAPKLTDAQTAACKEADEFLVGLEKELDGVRITSEVKTVNGKPVYIGKIDCANGCTDSEASSYNEYIFPIVDGIVGKEDMQAVLYITENGKDLYRMGDDSVLSALE